jgi:hypothetical protein
MLGRIHTFEAGLLLGVVLYTVAGGLGGAVLGIATQPPDRAALFVLAAALGCGFGYGTTTYLFAVYVANWLSEFLSITELNMIQFALFGALTGALLGAVQRSRTQAGWLALTGAIGFGIGILWENTLINFMIGLPFRVNMRVLGYNVWPSLVFGLAWGLFGAISGAVLGWGMKRGAPPAMETEKEEIEIVAEGIGTEGNAETDGTPASGDVP